MIRLASTTYIAQLVLSAGTADVVVSYSDQTLTGYAGGTQETAATAATQTICAAPAAATVRDIDYLSVTIKTTGGNVTIQTLNSSGSVTTKTIGPITLAVSEQLTYTHGSGWCAMDVNGNRKEVTSSVFSSITVSGLTASLPVFTDANKALASNAMTGTVNVVMSTSPTLTTPKATTTIGVGNATPSASGSGISFPATQSASTDPNTLDDYEEGTWTPNQGVGLTVVGAFASSGKYIKTGTNILIEGFINPATSVATTAGTIICTNTPFATGSGGATGLGSMTNNAVNATGVCLVDNGANNTVYACTTIAASAGLFFSATYQSV